MTNTAQGFPNISIPFVDANTGVIQQPWMQLLISLYTRTGGGSGGSTNSGEGVQIQEALGEQDEWKGKDDNPWQGLWGAALISSIAAGYSNYPLADIANNTFLANISGMTAPPSATTLTAFLDSAMGNTRGEILYRGAANWAALPLGANTQVLQSNGTDILWGAVSLNSLAQIGDATILSNVSGGNASPSANTLTQVIDHDTGGAARGALLVRGAASWGNLPLGTSNYVLTSNGTDAVWNQVSAGSLAPIADATILSNISGGAAAPAANSLTNIIDHDIGSSRGEILYRGVSNWAALALGANGLALISNGTDILWGTPALASIADATILSNISGGLAVPVANSLTSILDHDMGSARGDIVYRGAANWAALGLGSNGQVLGSNGTDLLWENVSYNMLPAIADSTFLANISGGASTPSATTETAFLDHAMGSARGNILYRGAANWAALALGITGQMLRSNGTDITWASVIGYAGDQSYQTANWASGTNFSTNCSFYTSATTQQAAEREILAGVFLISNLGGNQASSPQRDKVALSGMIEGQAGSGDTWGLYGVNVIDAGSMASTGYTAHTVELDLNNRSTVDLSSPVTIGGHTAQAFGASITGSSVKPCTAGLWITGSGAAGGPGNAQWDKGIWFTGNTAIGSACIKDDSQNQLYCLDVSAAVYQKGPINWNTGATAVTATAGAATLPVNPVGFLLFYNGGTPIKIPYYAN